MPEQVVRTLIIRGKAEGVDQVTRQTEQLARSLEHVAVASDATTKRALSIEAAYRRQTLALDQAARAQEQIAKQTRIAALALDQGKISSDQYRERVNLIERAYTKTASANDNFINKSKLTRHELVNLSRQTQDVVVSLASGQGLGTVLLQQGSQIFDVYQTAGLGVKGFVASALGPLARFALSTTGITTAVVGMGVAITASAHAWAAGQAEIDRALMGTGVAAGATRDQINGIAEAVSGSSRASISEAREAATAFAATGKVYAENLEQAATIAKDFALATGVSAADATKKLAADMESPSRLAQTLNQRFGFLNAGLLTYIQTLEAAGRRQEALKVVFDAAQGPIQKQAQALPPLTQLWNSLTKAVSNYIDKQNKADARTLERITGRDFGGFSQPERREQRQQSVQFLQRQLQDPNIRGGERQAATEDLEHQLEVMRRIEQQALLTAEATSTLAKRNDDLSLAAKKITESTFPQIEALQTLEGQLKQLEEARDAGVGGPNIESALAAKREEVNLTRESLAVQQAQAFHAEQLRATYGDVSLQTAVQLSNIQAQLPVAQARTHAERMVAEEAARVTQLVNAQVPAYEATKIAAAERAVREATVAASTQNQLQVLAAQLPVVRARSGEERAAAQEVARVTELIQQQLPLEQALAVAAAERALQEAETAKRFEDQIANMRLQTEIMKAQGTAAEAKLRAELAYQQAIQQGARPDQAAAIAAETKKQAEIQFVRAAQQGVTALRGQVREMSHLLSFAEQAAASFLHGGLGSKFEGFADPWTATASLGKGEGTSFFGGPLQQSFGNFVEQVSDVTAFKTANTLFGQGGFDVLSPAKKVTTVAFRDVNTVTFPGQSQPNVEGLKSIVDKVLMQGGTLQDAINKITDPNFLKDQKLFGVLPPDPTVLQNLVLDLIRLEAETTGNVEQERKFIMDQLAKLQAQPKTLATMEAIAELNRRLQELNQSTESLNDTMGNILSDIYMTDPRLSKIGFRADSPPLTYDPFKQGTTPTQIIINQTPVATSPTVGTTSVTTGTVTPVNRVPSPTPTQDTTSNFYQPRLSIPPVDVRYTLAEGGIMGPNGPMSLQRFQFGGMTSGGITTSPSLFMTSELSHPEAIIPLKNGAVPVDLAMPSAWERMFGEYQGGGRPPGEQVINVNIENINVGGAGDKDEGARRTAFQTRQTFEREFGRMGAR